MCGVLVLFSGVFSVKTVPDASDQEEAGPVDPTAGLTLHLQHRPLLIPCEKNCR